MVTIAVRDAPGFAPTASVTVPSPLPVAPLVIEIQSASLPTDHPQLAPAVTVRLIVPPEAGTDWLVGAIV